ncbi:hypothetical protein [Methylophilus sp. QUAN]|uniref:hypothetical protein n=1 Tax=Methylophilus sp. QUAN TaxID=2781020 RepID=UPI00188E75BD|nr:hypothetical protein [Methylophilus sp. QUAN]MBF4991102.1 hypothetical protein [Methylophilus sp. QUAN]
MSQDYVKLEQTFNRLATAINPIADKQTTDDLKQLSAVIAEVRHAAQQLKDGADILDVECRLMRSLFLKSSKVGE